MPVLRSMLFVPGNHGRRIEKAFASEADAVIIDLEDAVPASEKEATRDAVRRALDTPRHGLVYVRVNDVSTRWAFGDIRACVCERLDGIVLPKTESAEEVRKVDWLIGETERELDLPAGKLDLIPLVETARGVSRVDEITLSSPRVRRIAFGAGDFTVDLGIDLTSDGVEIHYARSRIAVASRSAGIDGPIDTVYMEVTNVQGLEADTRRAKQIGFQGKLVIHPDQILPVHRVFSPTLDEVQEAREIIQAYEEAVSRGVGAIKVRGKLVDYPIVNRARRVMELGNPRLG